MNIYTPLPYTQLVTGSSVLPTDIYAAVDTTDTTQSPLGSTKQYTVAQLQTGLQINSLVTTLINLVVTPATGSCTISFNLRDAAGNEPNFKYANILYTGGSDLSISGIAASSSLTLIDEIDLGTNVFIANNGLGFVGVVISGTTSSGTLYIAMQAGGPVAIPFSIN